MPRTRRTKANNSWRSLSGLAIAALSAAVLGGCKEEPIRVYDAPKSPTAKSEAVAGSEGSDSAAARPPPRAIDGQDAAQPQGPIPAAPTVATPVTIGDMKATAPAGWRQDLSFHQMRAGTFIVGDPARKTEVVISKLNGSAGGPLENVNRWRDQVGLPHVTAINEQPVSTVRIAGQEATLFDLAGPDSTAPTRRMLQAVAPRGDATYYFKITGDAALVAEQKANFEAFLKSIEIPQ